MVAKHATSEPVLLTLEAIDAADDRPEITVEVLEWGGAVKIRGLSYDQLSDARANAWDSRKGETNEDLLNAWCLALGMVEPKITPEIAKDWIIKRQFGPVNQVLSEILNASGLGARAQADAKSTSAE
jgi:hypothetical protein